MLKDKCVVVGVTGGIAAYKTASIVSALKKERADVHVIMTKNATEFISPLVFETLTGNKCMTDTFDRDFKFDVAHISIAKAADYFVVAPQLRISSPRHRTEWLMICSQRHFSLRTALSWSYLR